MPIETVGTPLALGGFLTMVVVMLALDLGVFHRKAHVVTPREAAIWSGVWLALAAGFALILYFWLGSQIALEFATGYVIEKALAVDNIFVFVVIFSTFGIPVVLQHRVLFWGVFGALIMRAGFIMLGGAMLQRFHWTIYVFGGILIFTGIKLLVQRGAEMHPEKNPVVRLFQRIFPVSHELEGSQFFIVRAGRRQATPLFLSLVAVEVSDVIFAVDSIPAIFAITADPFIVFTSNIFAILGLRSLYFFLADFIERFHHLKIGLSFVLTFVGGKMLLIDVYKIPILASLAVIALILAASIVASLVRPRVPEVHAPKAE